MHTQMRKGEDTPLPNEYDGWKGLACTEVLDTGHYLVQDTAYLLFASIVLSLSSVLFQFSWFSAGVRVSDVNLQHACML